MTDWSSRLAKRGHRLKPSAIRQTAKYAADPAFISFASGSPNPGLFPYEAMAQVTAEIMADPQRRAQALQYAGSEGYLPLRELIVEHLQDAGARTAVDNIVITNGSQQALEFVAKLLIDPGDRIIVTNPTYLGALQAFDLFEPVYAGVGLDQSGIDLAALEREFRAGAKFMYLMPDFGNPSGVTLPLEQRQAILELSRRHGVPILEDQAYEQLRFTDERLPSMLALDAERGDDGTVIYAGTFSKTLVPGLRVGWLVAPRPAAEKLIFLKQASDLQAGSLNQMVVHGVARAIFGEQVPMLRAAYSGRRDALLGALRRHMPQSVTWNEPEGGMFVWLTLPPPLDATQVQARAVEEKVVFVPGAPFFADGSGTATLRLSFSSVAEDAMGEGVERLARAIRASLSAACEGP
jgi:DNA-binding transcriptional MocR family regulator